MNLNNLKRPVILLVGLILVLSPLPVAAQNEQLSPSLQNSIAVHCTNIQSSLKRFELSELVNRYDRGHAYEQLLRQMTALNTRFVTHKLNASELVQITSNLQGVVDQFRTVYDRNYDKTLLSIIRIDCKQKPAEFYNLIVKARTERAQIAAYVVEIDRLLEQYKVAVLSTKATLLPDTQPAGGAN